MQPYINLYILNIQYVIKNTIKKKKFESKKCIVHKKDYFYLLCYVFFYFHCPNTYIVMYCEFIPILISTNISAKIGTIFAYNM